MEQVQENCLPRVIWCDLVNRIAYPYEDVDPHRVRLVRQIIDQMRFAYAGLALNDHESTNTLMQQSLELIRQGAPF